MIRKVSVFIIMSKALPQLIKNYKEKSAKIYIHSHES